MSKIQTALNAAMRDICKIGIGKTQKNEQQGYRFRGVEQAMNEMSPIMVNHGITVASSYSDLQVTERAKAEAGKATRFVTVLGTFTFTAEDDSSIVSQAYGEAMDSGDKAVIKAQSVAFRTALFQLFVVPTVAMDSELDDGADSDDSMLDEFREVAMAGSAKLKAHFEKAKPPPAWWARHNGALKEAAAMADREQQ